MVTLNQMRGYEKLMAENLRPVNLPHTAETPIPGLILFVDDGHQRLEMLRPDGTAVDLLKVYHAVDSVFNWNKSNTDRLGPLAEAIHGRKVD